MTTKKPLIGAHLSIAGGFQEAIYHAQELGCTAVQFFSKSNRQWHAAPITPEQLERYQEALTTYPLGYIAIHASYLINIASSDPAKRAQARHALAVEYERAVALQADALILHPGSRGDQDIQTSLEIVAQELNALFAKAPQAKTVLCLETMAGQGTVLCSTFQELATLLAQVEHQDRVGVCFDTCHVYTAGYDILNDYRGVIQQFSDVIGLDRLKVIHLNDSKKPLNSHVDRHEHIGQGQLGMQFFKQLLQDKQLAHVPKILETPKEHPDDDAKNLRIVWDLTQDKHT